MKEIQPLHVLRDTHLARFVTIKTSQPSTYIISQLFMHVKEPMFNIMRQKNSEAHEQFSCLIFAIIHDVMNLRFHVLSGRTDLLATC